MSKGRTITDRSDLKGKEELKETLKLANKSHERYLLKSNNNDLENAIDFYVQVIKKDPFIAESHYRLASLMWEKGQIDIESAIEQCQEASKIDPKSIQAKMYLGYFLKTAGNYKEAEKEFLNAIRLNYFKSARARIALSILLFEKTEVSKLTFSDFLKASYGLISGIPMLMLDYTSMRMLFKNFKEDLNIIMYRFTGSAYKRMKNFKMAVKTYENAAKNTANSSIFYTKMAELALKEGKPEIAVQSYRNAIKYNPQNIDLRIKLATTLQEHFEDDLNQIIDCYNKLIEMEPHNSRFYYELGHSYLSIEDKFSAINAFRKASEIEPENPFYHNSLAYALIQLDDYDAGIEEYQKAIKLNPDNEWTSVVCQAQGAIYQQIKGNQDAAIVAYQTSTVLDPKNVDAYIALGEVYHEKGDIKKAIENYCEAVNLDPVNANTYCSLGLALWEKDCVSESIVAYQKAIELDSKEAITYNNLGIVYLDGTGQIDEALNMFNEALKRNPNYALAYYNKGRCCQMLGNKTDAADCYQMALDLNKITNEINGEEIEEKLYNLFSV